MTCFTIDDINELTIALSELTKYAETHTKDGRVVKVYPPDVIAIDYIDDKSVVKIKVNTSAVKEYSYYGNSPHVKITYVAYFDAAKFDNSLDAICDITDDLAAWLDSKVMTVKVK